MHAPTLQCYISDDGHSSSSRYHTGIHTSGLSNTILSIQSDHHVVSCSEYTVTTIRRWNNSPIRIVPLSCTSWYIRRVIYSPTASGVISVTLQSTTISEVISYKTLSHKVDINDTVVSIHCSATVSCQWEFCINRGIKKHLSYNHTIEWGVTFERQHRKYVNIE